jgi:hypothetical protein
MMNTVFCHSKALDKHDQTAHSSALKSTFQWGFGREEGERKEYGESEV